MMIYMYVLICTFFGNVNSDLSCIKRPLTVRGKVAATPATVSLLEHSASNYSDSRSQYGIDVRIEFDSISRDTTTNEDNFNLFRIPTVFSWAGHNEMTFPILSRALVIVFNLPGIYKLYMPVETVSNIYKGRVNMWNDPQIQQYNPNITLPAVPISVQARQEEMESTTALFTYMLTRVDPEWEQTRGVIRGPAFVNGTCCESVNWKNVVKLFPKDTIGIVGMTLSIPYTIGYVIRPDVEAYNLTQITLLKNNQTSEIVDPTITALQIPMASYANASSEVRIIENGTIVVMKDHMVADGAYPMAAHAYLIINMIHESKKGMDCCLVQELVGFLDSLIFPQDAKQFTSRWFAPVPPAMADLINRTVLNRIVCDGQNMYQVYISSKVSYISQVSKFTTSELILLIVFAFLIVGITIFSSIFAYNKIRKRRADANFFIINLNRLKMETPPSFNLPNCSNPPKSLAEDGLSAIESKRATNITREIIFLKNVFFMGDLDEHVKVNLIEFPLPIIQKYGNLKTYTINQWSEKTRMLANKLRRSSSNHRNLASFLGLVEFGDEKAFSVFEYCAKGTLHYNLATCRYRLTDSIKRYLALDVASGLEYLHTRVGVVHGQLNSLTCLLDLAWTVKIILWDQTSLHYSESIQRSKNGDEAFFSEDHRWRIKQEEVKEILFSEKGQEELIRLVYLDPKLPMVYPQAAVDVYSFGMLVAEIFMGKVAYLDELMMEDCGDTESNIITPDTVNKQALAFLDMLEKKFIDTNFNRIPKLSQGTPKYAQNIVEACLRIDAAKRPSMKSILRHLSLSANDVNKGGLVDAMMETMDTYAEQLEEKVEERTAELKQMTAKMRDLLNEVLPPQIAEKLFQGEAVPPEYFENVTVYFSDIVGFTIISARSTPIQVMNFLNDLWLTFDSIIQDFDVYKVDTIGDAYMVCSGLPNRNGVEHCRQIGRMSIALLEACKKFQIAHLADEKLHVRIGLNSGPVTAGVVGLKMPQYCVFGDTVNTAARMESTSLPGRIQISSSTYMLLVDHFPGEFCYEYRGEINVKGKGNMLTYWLLSSDDAAKRSRNSAISTQF